MSKTIEDGAVSEATKEELIQQLTEKEQAARAAFAQEYDALCRKHGMGVACQISVLSDGRLTASPVVALLQQP